MTAAGLRPLTQGDVRVVAEIERELFGRSAWTESMLREELGAPGRTYLAVDDDAGLAGYAGAWWDGDVLQVMTIGVRPPAQGRGLGRALLAALLDLARDLGASAVLLEVRVDNDRAIDLYRRAGFVVLARRRRYYQPEDVDAWTMRLDLTPPGSPART